MLEVFHILVILLAVTLFAAFSRRIKTSIVTLPMVFTAYGWLIGQGRLSCPIQQ